MWVIVSDYLLNRGGLFLVDAILMMMVSLYLYREMFLFPTYRRTFHYMLETVSVVSFLTNFSMYTGLGIYKQSEAHSVHIARYVDWMIVTPTQLLMLGNIGQLTPANNYGVAFLAMVMIMSGLIADMITHPIWAKWFIYGFSWVTFIPVCIFLSEDFDYQVVRQFAGTYTADRYFILGRYLVSLYAGYAILSFFELRGHHDKIALVGYFILDLFTKIGLTWWILVCIYSHYTLTDTQQHDILEKEDERNSISTRSQNDEEDLSTNPPMGTSSHIPHIPPI